MTDAERLQAAHADAQRAFSAMCNAQSYADPDAPETKAYIAAERRVDGLLIELQWMRASTELDLALGDHYAGMPS